MRFRLRTLLILLGVLPPLLAVCWLGYCKWRELQEWERDFWGSLEVNLAPVPFKSPVSSRLFRANAYTDPMRILHKQLSLVALRAIVEEFVTRDGTDDTPVEPHVASVLR